MTHAEQFTRLWTRAQPIVSSYINSLVPDFHEAEDLLQSAAVVLLRKFGEYDSNKPFLPWALGVTKFEILASRRAHARSLLSYRPELADALANAHEELSGELESRARALKKCLEHVQGPTREIVRFRYQECLKPGQIASRLGKSAVAVRVALSRVRAILRDCIERRLAVNT